MDLKREKAEDRERKEREAEEKRKGEIQIVELYKPFGNTVPWFVSAEKECVSPTSTVRSTLFMELIVLQHFGTLHCD